jgi:predicted ATPase
MKLAKVFEQRVAIFGGAGSGKTVLLSSFYGAAHRSRRFSRGASFG